MPRSSLPLAGDPGGIDLQAVAARLQDATASATSMAEVRRFIGAFALAADTVPEADRRAVMAARLPRHTWPYGVLRRRRGRRDG